MLSAEDNQAFEVGNTVSVLQMRKLRLNRGQVICPRSHSKWESQDLNQLCAACKEQVLNYCPGPLLSLLTHWNS